MTGSSEFSLAWLNGFLDCMEDIAPFLRDIQFKHAPNRLDEDLTEVLSDQSLFQVPNDKSAKPHGIDPNAPQLPGVAMPKIFNDLKRPLAGDIDHHILSALETRGSLVNPNANSADQNLQEWLAFGERIRFGQGFPGGTNRDNSARLGNAMRNLPKRRPSSIPSHYKLQHCVEKCG